MALYDLLWLLMFLYLPVVGGYNLSDTVLGEKKGLVNKLKLKKSCGFCCLFVCFPARETFMAASNVCIFYLFVREY